MQLLYNKQHPQVSIIIPTYNFAELIRATLDSIKEQSYQNWECIIVDDGSVDNTKDVVQEYIQQDQRFHYIRHEKNLGLEATRNMGLKNSRGKYIQLLDADDMLERRKIEIHVEFLENNPRVDIVYGEVRFFTSENPQLRLYSRYSQKNHPWTVQVVGSGEPILRQIVEKNFMAVSAACFKRCLSKEVGSFDTRLKARGDWDFWIRCAAAGKYFYYLNTEETLALMRWHEKSKTNDPRKNYLAEIALRRKIKTSNYDKEIKKINSVRLGLVYSRLGFHDIMSDNRLNGLKSLIFATFTSRKMKFLLYGLILPFLNTATIKRIISLPAEKKKLILKNKLLGRVQP